MRNGAAGIITPAMLANYKRFRQEQRLIVTLKLQKGAPPENASIEELANYFARCCKDSGSKCRD